MTRNITIGTLTVMLLCWGCETNKKYIYIEVVNKMVKVGDSVKAYKAGVIIHEDTDSAAYLNAYGKFCISLRASDRFNSSPDKLPFRPVGFLLMNENGVDISKSVTFIDKDSKEQKIIKQIREIPVP